MFLAHLIDRALEGRSAIAPRRASRFEPEAGPAEPGWMETEAQAPVAAPSPPPTLRSSGDGLVSPTRRPAPPETPDAIQAIVTPPPPGGLETPSLDGRPAHPTATTIVHRLEQLAPPPAATPPAASRPARLEPSPAPEAPGLHEVHTHERVEVRHTDHEIERRLETLTREHVIERIAREAAGLQTPAAQAAGGRDPVKAAQPTVAVRPRSAPPQPPPAPISRRDAPMPTPLAATPSPSDATTVHVTIGRVEVRGGPAAAPRPATPRRAEPRLGLDDYLRRREQA